MDDNEIIALYNKRQEIAIEETKKKYHSYLLSIANNILHNQLDNEECVSDTYLKTWNAIPPTKPLSLKAFTGKITRNGALNRVRYYESEKRKNLLVCENFDELEEILSSNDTVENHIEEQEISRIVNQFLKDQTLEKRVIFIRRYWYLDSIKEISERMKISESKVKSILKRERDSLKKILITEGIL